ncbi:MAG: hypothetical protein V1833_01265 [Elusimicrobiota bacterium]
MSNNFNVVVGTNCVRADSTVRDRAYIWSTFGFHSGIREANRRNNVKKN